MNIPRFRERCKTRRIPTRSTGVVWALVLACALLPRPSEAQVVRRVVGSLALSGRVVYQFLARSDRMVELAARTSDGSSEVVSAAISPDSAEVWTSSLTIELAANSSRRELDNPVLQQTLLVARSDSARNAFVLFVSDTAFAQIAVTASADDIRRFVQLLNSAASVAKHLPAGEFGLRTALHTSAVVPIPETQRVPYPKALRELRMTGEVRARFIVDSRGRVQPGTFKVLLSTHSEFSEAVRSHSRSFRFIPAMVDRRPVSQMVTQSFIFNIRP